MRNIKQSFIEFQQLAVSDVLIITFFTILAHGLTIYWLGFYTDDWTFLWTYQHYGADGLTQYFSTNRPFWGLFYQITMPILGIKPLVWHFFALFWGLAASLGTYWLVVKVWPSKTRIGLLAGLFFSVYPGFVLQPIAITFGHIYWVYTIFIVSLVLTVIALTSTRYELQYTIVSLILSAINLLAMEYFYTLEAIRLLLIVYVVAQGGGLSGNLSRIGKKYLPYFILLILVSVWRAFFFDVQTYNYDLALVPSLKTNLFGTLYELLKTLVTSIYNSTVLAWGQPFLSLINNWRLTPFYLLMLGQMIGVLILLGIVLVVNVDHPDELKIKIKSNKDLILFGIIGLILAGWPFYLTDLPVIPYGFKSRFTLPFILSGSIFLAAIIETIPIKVLKITLASLLISSSIGYHLLTQNDFRYVTIENNRLISQLVTRIPGLTPGTTILSDEGSEYFTFTTLTAQLNLIYEPEKYPEVNYGWVFPRELALKTTTPLEKAKAFDINLVTKIFYGNSSNIVSIQQPGGGCLRVLGKSSEVKVPELINYKVKWLSNPALILQDSAVNSKIDDLYGSLELENWCSLYQQAELALQYQDYASISYLFNKAENNRLQPKDLSEWYPFIEAFGQAQDWPMALTITDRIITGRNRTETRLCRIWESFYHQNDLTTAVRDGILTEELIKLGCIQPHKWMAK